MRANARNVLYLILSALTLLHAGCTDQKPMNVFLKPDNPQSLAQQSNVSRRFQDSQPRSQTAVESAMALSARYAELSQQMTLIKENNQHLTDENQRLKESLVPCKSSLTQTEKELAEANDLLIEMRIELNNWKTNIIGFRNEMRDADKTQLEALLKILTALGGESKAEPASANHNNGPAKTAPQQPDNTQPQPFQAGTASGELNG